MENKKCFYLVEGECEEKLLKALKACAHQSGNRQKVQCRSE